MRRFVFATVLGLTMTATSAVAADEETGTTLTPAVAAAATSLAQHNLATVINRAAEYRAPRRPFALPALYGGSIALQGYDAYSTLSALKSGASEANPLMNGITRSPLAFVALKAGLTTASIVGAEQLWKDHHRVAAIVMMAASNGMMAAVAAHNNAVLQRVR